MPVTDPIADMLARIRNAVAAGHDFVQIPHSKVKERLLELMKREGFIWHVEEAKSDNGFPALNVKLRYYDDREPVIHGLKRVSKPGLRIYTRCREIPYGHGGMGVLFLSTPMGIMTDRESRHKSVGGEVLCYVW